MFYLRLMLRSSLALGLAMALAVPAAAADEVPKVEKKKKERLVCEAIMTGTRIRSQRVCMTKDQWRVANERAHADLTAGREQQSVVRYGTSGRSTCNSSTVC
jgi:hypothetical protein